MRAPGFPQASFASESLMDELAERIGMDPVEFRKKNATNDHHRRQLDKGAEVIGWSRRKMQAGADVGPIKCGFGCGIGAWGGGGGPKCVVNLTISRDGSVVAEVGSQDLGTGTRTYIKAIVAEELGLEMSDVAEKIGSSKFGDANASGGSTTAASLAPAVKDAAYKAKAELAKLVAPLVGAEADAVTFADRKIGANGKSIEWKQACGAVPAAGLKVQGTWQPNLSADGRTASFAEVEVDIETGHIKVVRMCHVQDGGLILNRLATESQINGGMIQSIGMVLYEQRVMDGRLGVMLNPQFGDYKLPGTLEIGELIPVIDDGDTRQAVIGIAEPANIPGVGAVANAVYNACGVRVRDLPITPDKILNGLYACAAKGRRDEPVRMGQRKVRRRRRPVAVGLRADRLRRDAPPDRRRPGSAHDAQELHPAAQPRGEPQDDRWAERDHARQQRPVARRDGDAHRDRRACRRDEVRAGPRRRDPFGRQPADPQLRHDRRQPLSAATLLVLPARQRLVPQARRRHVLCQGRREQVSRDLPHRLRRASSRIRATRPRCSSR
ncbi:MAG: molybdopterin-dependent oxidoreductase [Rubrivivax sp.]